jgi:hypothetical protein
MAITDAERHRLHAKLDHVLGEEDAAVLISHLPPSGWSDVARVRDLDQLEARLTLRMDRMDEVWDARFDAMDAKWEGKLDAMDAKWTGKLDAMDANWTGKLEAMDAKWDGKLDAMDTRWDARFERGLREQTHRFLAAMAVMLTVSTAIQGAVARFLG